MTRIYVAGQMRGLDDCNFPAFDRAAAQLRSAGFEVFNPAERDREVYGADADFATVVNVREALAADLAWICEHAEGVALLPGWTKSRGACAEYATALALDIPARPVGAWLGLIGQRVMST